MAETSGYQVLARKYRPETFADLVGQEAMVRTLRNAFGADRIAQAFMLTGIRGTGKTTTARIVAKGLNCTGQDGQGGPTTDPCGQCPQCRGIAAGTHVDVIEMDAASNTSVDNIRANVLDSVTYAPAESRYKIYIVDEVHMLSTSAFNALLKTLEEPPPHVKFLFATTEIRKVPVTVLSRCQRFDLRRIEPEDMMALLRRIAEAEGAAITDAALALITRAAEGSARDATSLLDQAIGMGAGTETDAPEVRAMLGLADRGRVLDLFEAVMSGDAGGALNELAGQYADGADPLSVLRDLAEITHWLAVMKVTPEAAEDPTVPPDTRTRGAALSERLSQRVLGRAWQMLLKALDEVAAAPNAMMAAEMALIRMTHVADLPPPEDLLRQVDSLLSGAPAGAGDPPGRTAAVQGAATGATGPPGPDVGLPGHPATDPVRSGGGFVSPSASAPDRARTGMAAGFADPAAPRGPATGPATGSATRPATGLGTGPAPGSSPSNAGRPDTGTSRAAPGRAPGAGGGGQIAAARPAAAAEPLARLAAFDAVVALIRANRDVKLLVDVETGLQLVSYSPGRIAFAPTADAPADLAQRLGARLQDWTGARWAVSVEAGPGTPTIAAARSAADDALKAQARDHPLVEAVRAAFPGATITRITTPQDIAAAAAEAALPEAEESWDPFEDD